MLLPVSLLLLFSVCSALFLFSLSLSVSVLCVSLFLAPSNPHPTPPPPPPPPPSPPPAFRLTVFTSVSVTHNHVVCILSAGHGDLVRCFHCKGGLKTWESSDKPWIEHCRWFPRCPFVRLSMGQKFVEAVQKLNNPDTRPTVRLWENLMPDCGVISL